MKLHKLKKRKLESLLRKGGRLKTFWKYLGCTNEVQDEDFDFAKMSSKRDYRGKFRTLGFGGSLMVIASKVKVKIVGFYRR